MLHNCFFPANASSRKLHETERLAEISPDNVYHPTITWEKSIYCTEYTYLTCDSHSNNFLSLPFIFFFLSLFLMLRF